MGPGAFLVRTATIRTCFTHGSRGGEAKILQGPGTRTVAFERVVKTSVVTVEAILRNNQQTQQNDLVVDAVVLEDALLLF